MGIVIYSSEEEMPKHLRKEKQPEWNILDRMDWDEWNFVPTMTPQKSKFHNHVTWNSHRTDEPTPPPVGLSGRTDAPRGCCCCYPPVARRRAL